MVFAADETLTITTYYPSPYGSYNEFKVASNTWLAYSSGSVGIGTTSPQTKLDVQQVRAAQITNLRLGVSNNSAVTNDEISLDYLWYGNQIYAGRISGWVENAGTNTGGLKFYTASATSINAAPTMTMNGAGNVGIGTTGPGKRLHVLSTETVPMRVDTSNALGGGIEFSKDNTRNFLLTTASVVEGTGTNYSPAIFADGASLGFHVKTGGSATTRLFVSSAGNVGIGTTGPASKLDVYGSADNVAGYVRNAQATGTVTAASFGVKNNNDNVLLLQIYGSSYSTNGPHFADGTHLYTGAPGGMSIETRNTTSGADIRFYTNSMNERMRITKDGNVGIGTASPNAKFEIKQSSNGPTGGLRTVRSDTTGYADWFAGADGNAYVQLNAASYCGTTGGGTGWSCSSDERLKDVQGNFERGINDLLGITPIVYRSRTQDHKRGEAVAGFSAQNVRAFIPEAVGIGPDGYYTLSDRPIVAATVNAIKKQQNQLQNQQKKIEEQESRLQKDEKDIEYLKKELIGATAMLIESNQNLQANTREIQELKAEIVNLQKKL